MADTPPRPRWPRRGGLDASPPRLTPRTPGRSLAAGGEAALLREQLDALRDEADRLREENHALLKQRAAFSVSSVQWIKTRAFRHRGGPGPGAAIVVTRSIDYKFTNQLTVPRDCFAKSTSNEVGIL